MHVIKNNYSGLGPITATQMVGGGRLCTATNEGYPGRPVSPLMTVGCEWGHRIPSKSQKTIKVNCSELVVATSVKQRLEVVLLATKSVSTNVISIS